MTYLTRLVWQLHKYDFKHPSQIKAIAQHTHKYTQRSDKLAGAPRTVTLQLNWELQLDL